MVQELNLVFTVTTNVLASMSAKPSAGAVLTTHELSNSFPLFKFLFSLYRVHGNLAEINPA